ncbi:MAG: hypothetical protein J6T52_10470 [Bacteroidaceae bacterium]|nr:hypothetical protein [Bacteroidaceae bacterium]
MKKYMSFMAFAMLAVFSLAFVSCGDDDDEDEITAEATVVGTWEVTENNFQLKIKEVFGMNIEDWEEDEEESLNVGDRITFFENGTYRTKNETGKWKKSGNVLRVKSDDLDEDVYTFTDMTIKKLTTKVMELTLSVEGYFSYDVKMKKV